MKRLVIMTTLGVGILASDAFADNLSGKATVTESLTASPNYFLSNNPSGATGETVTTGTFNFLAKTLTTNYYLNAFYSYYNFFGPGAVDTSPTWGTPANVNFSMNHTELVTTYNAGASWTRADAAVTQFAQTGTSTARGSINTYSANGSIVHDLGRIDSFSLNAVASTTNFTDPTQFPFVDVTSTASWNHILSSTTTLSNFVSLDWFSEDDPNQSQRLFWKLTSGISSSLSPRLSLNAHVSWAFVNSYQTASGAIPSVPVTTTSFIPQTGTGNGFLGDITFSYRPLKTTTVSLTAAQAVAPLFNGQLQASKQISLTLTHGINHLSNLSLSAAFSFVPATSGSAPFGTQGSASQFFSVSASYGYQLAREWYTNLSYTYRQRNDTTGIVGSSLVSFTLTRDFTLFGNPTAINVAERERARERAQQSIGYIFPGFH